LAETVGTEERLARLERLVPRPDLPVPPETTTEISREAASYVSALEQLAAEGRVEEALRIAVRLAPYWIAHGMFGEGRSRLQALLDSAGDISPVLRAQSLERLATLAFEKGEEERGRALCEESLATAQQAGDEIAVARAHGTLSRCSLMTGDLDSARRHARAAEQIHRARDDERALDSPLHVLAYADYIAGDDEHARTGFEETLALNRRVGNRFAVARELTNLGSVETRAGNLERAHELCHEALRIAVDLDNSTLATYCVVNLAGVASANGDHERAARLLGAGEAMLATAGMTLNPGTAIEYSRHVERTRTSLGDAEYEQLNRAGHELDRGAAVAYALGASRV
jgi:tetratricopeptide (TPR) repeat protein